MSDDGSMARMPELEVFAVKHGLPIVTIDDLIAYRLMRDSLVKIVAQGTVETPKGTFDSLLFESVLDQSQHLALVKNRQHFATEVVNVRVHRQRPLVDVFTSPATGGRHLVEYGLDMLAKSNTAVFIYLSQMRGDHTFSDYKEAVRMTSEQVEEAPRGQNMDARQLGIGAQIIRALGIQRMRTHVSAQRTLKGIAGFGLELVDHVLIESPTKEGE